LKGHPIASPENPPLALQKKLPMRMLIRITVEENHPAFAILFLIPKDVESRPQIPIGNLRKDHFLLGFHGLHPLRNRRPRIAELGSPLKRTPPLLIFL